MELTLLILSKLGKIRNKLKPVWAQFCVYFLHWGNIPVFCLFYFIRSIILGVERIVWRFNGVRSHLDHVYNEGSYQTSAQLLKVWASCKPSPFDKVRKCFFLATHHSFENPNYVLRNPNVILAEVRLNSALFVELKRPISFYKVKKNQFLHLTLVKEAVKIIEMPRESFHKVAEESGSPENWYEHITFLFNAGRCGSTLVTSIMEEIDTSDRTMILSEPGVLFDFVFYKRHLAEEDFHNLLRSMLYLLLKPVPGKSRVVLKPTTFISSIAEDFHAVMPGALCLYCHRDPLQLVLAHERAFGALPFYKLLQLCLRLKCWYLGSTFIGFHRYPSAEEAIDRYLQPTMFETCLAIWSENFRHYKKQCKKFHYPDLLYDDFLENPSEFMRKLTTLLNLPMNQLPGGSSVLDRDSQADTIVSQKLLKGIPLTPYTPQLKQRTDRFCDALQLPRLNWDQLSGRPHVTNGRFKQKI